jgi:hypothetical protein
MVKQLTLNMCHQHAPTHIFQQFTLGVIWRFGAGFGCFSAKSVQKGGWETGPFHFRGTRTRSSETCDNGSMRMRNYHVVKCNDCDRFHHVRSEGMQVPRRFILACACGHFYEYFSNQIQLMPMEFKPLRELPRESEDGDLERMMGSQL